jgi:hypothetical protein
MNRHEYLTEFRELQKEIQEIKQEKDRHWAKLNKKFSELNAERYQDPLYKCYKLADKKEYWLAKVKDEMLYERYFFKHSKGKEGVSKAKARDGEFLDDKYYYDIRDILGKWYHRVMRNVNYFHLLYEGASEYDIDPEGTSGISNSTWGFIGDFVYKIIREIAEPRLYFYQENQQYNGVLFRNLWEWRNLKGSFFCQTQQKQAGENLKGIK